MLITNQVFDVTVTLLFHFQTKETTQNYQKKRKEKNRPGYRNISERGKPEAMSLKQYDSRI